MLCEWLLSSNWVIALPTCTIRCVIVGWTGRRTSRKSLLCNADYGPSIPPGGADGSTKLIIWERLVMPQGLSNASAIFNRSVTQLFRPHRGYAQTYSDDIFVHSHAEHDRSDIEHHLVHLRAVIECMRMNKLYANASKCIFGAEEIPFLGCLIGKRGLQANSATIKAIEDWPVSRSQKRPV